MPDEVDSLASLPLPSFPSRLKDRLPDAVRYPQDVVDWFYKLANGIGKRPSGASSPYLWGYVESLEDAQALLEHTRSRGWFGPFPAYVLDDDSGATFDTKLYHGASRMARDMGRFDERPDPDHDEARVQWALRIIAEWFDREKVKLCGGGIVRPKPKAVQPTEQTPAADPGATMLPAPPGAQGGKCELVAAASMPNTARVAGQQYAQAVEKAQAEGKTLDTDKAAYFYFKEHLAESPDEMPAVNNWMRYLTASRTATGTQKKKPRAKRVGRSIVGPNHESLATG